MAGHIPATVGDELQEFIRSGSSLPFDWVSNNCGFWVCDWIRLKTGRDPVKKLRGRFISPVGFQRYVFDLGGNESFSRLVAHDAGLKETRDPQRGDVGLVTTGAGIAMAICIGDSRWAAKSKFGVCIESFPLITAWRV